ncbi:hypothetical protein JVU11DRAFT_9104 [Chiua virens]|nr:hypothetical protein JVU11DRAFT_9104 [Chiua virens]
MSPPGATTVILPIDLGSASKFEESYFPVAYHDAIDSAINKGSLLLSSTLDEIIKIKEMGVDLSSNPQFLRNTRLKYLEFVITDLFHFDPPFIICNLAAKQAKLEKRRKSKNPIKYILNYRAARVFYAAALSLHMQTRETSERMQRREKEMRAVPSTEIRIANDADRLDANIGGIAIQLPGPLNAEQQQTIMDVANAIAAHATNPFMDNPRIPQLGDNDSVVTLADTTSLISQDAGSSNSQEAPPTSADPTSPSLNFFFLNSVLTVGSNVHEVTLNQGSGNISACCGTYP